MTQLGFAVLLIAVVLGVGLGQAVAETGNGLDAFPGAVRVGFPEPMSPGTSVRSSLGYGFRRNVLADGDKRQKFLGIVAASHKVKPWLGLGMRLDGRHERHTGGGNTDDAWVGDPRFHLRLSLPEFQDLKLGLQTTVWLPGNNAPSIVAAATTLDTRLLAGFSVKSMPLTIALNAGFRLDRSAKSIESPFDLSDPDRISLGLSDSNAVLLGAGAVWKMEQVDLLAEWTWDYLVGKQAPRTLATPMRGTLGARMQLNDSMSVNLAIDISPTKRPRNLLTTLQPLEPRVAGLIGFEIRRRPQKTSSRNTESDPDEEVDEEPAGEIHLRAIDGREEPIVVSGTIELADSRRVDFTTGNDGTFVLNDAALGDASVTANAGPDRQVSKDFIVADEGATEVTLEIPDVLPDGLIRGVVQLTGAKKKDVSIRIEDLDIERTLKSDTNFSIEVPDGTYTVEISCPGFKTQNKRVRVEKNGVTVLNVLLFKKRRGR